MDKNKTGLPPGWKYGEKRCVVFKHLEDFKYAEVRYEPHRRNGGNDYVLYTVNCDGPGHEIHQGVFEDLNKAIKAGDRL